MSDFSDSRLAAWFARERENLAAAHAAAKEPPPTPTRPKTAIERGREAMAAANTKRNYS